LVWFYNKYFLKKSPQNSKIELNENENIEDLKSNLIYNLNYKSTDLENNIYMISSKSGEMSQNGSEFLMNSVNARIILNDKSEIIITSDNALYNNNNYNTEFYGNVVSKYGVQTIFSQKMKLDFDINKIKIYEDVLFENLNTKIKTDNIEFDLITKNVLISRDDKTKKVNLSSKF
tara:strand:+ start:57 stop:581 length:525 start_codon:yes stop_codon:yes gene_type:complete